MSLCVPQIRRLDDLQARDLLAAMGVTPLTAASIVSAIAPQSARKSNNCLRYVVMLTTTVFIGNLHYASCPAGLVAHTCLALKPPTLVKLVHVV